jgi:hypothetical protein
VKVRKSGKFQVYVIKIPGDESFSRSFQGLANLKIKFQDFPGAVQTLVTLKNWIINHYFRSRKNDSSYF